MIEFTNLLASTGLTAASRSRAETMLATSAAELMRLGARRLELDAAVSSLRPDATSDAPSGNAADVIGQGSANLIVAGVAGSIQQSLGGNNHAGSAVATLDRLLGDEGFLQGVQLLGRSQALNGDNRQTLHLLHRNLARWRILPINKYLARVTLFQATAKFWPLQAQVVAQHVKQGGFWVHIKLMAFPIHMQTDCFRHTKFTSLHG
jgi:hypothetical protein